MEPKKGDMVGLGEDVAQERAQQIDLEALTKKYSDGIFGSISSANVFVEGVKEGVISQEHLSGLKSAGYESAGVKFERHLETVKDEIIQSISNPERFYTARQKLALRALNYLLRNNGNSKILKKAHARLQKRALGSIRENILALKVKNQDARIARFKAQYDDYQQRISEGQKEAEGLIYKIKVANQILEATDLEFRASYESLRQGEQDLGEAQSAAAALEASGHGATETQTLVERIVAQNLKYGADIQKKINAKGEVISNLRAAKMNLNLINRRTRSYSEAARKIKENEIIQRHEANLLVMFAKQISDMNHSGTSLSEAQVDVEENYRIKQLVENLEEEYQTSLVSIPVLKTAYGDPGESGDSLAPRTAETLLQQYEVAGRG